MTYTTPIVQGHTEVGFVDIMLDVCQRLRHQLSQNLLPPQYNLRPRLQVQDTEVGLRQTQKQCVKSKTF